MTLSDLNEYLTFEEIQEEFPQITFTLQWTAHNLVGTAETQGIQKKYNKTLKCWMFSRGSIIVYIQFVVFKNRRKLKTIESELIRSGISPNLPDGN